LPGFEDERRANLHFEIRFIFKLECKKFFKDKPIDWDNLNLDKMRVGQLKDLLRKLGDSCKGCVEKVDFVQRIRELMPKKETGEEL
jgi:hypothetical protein